MDRRDAIKTISAVSAASILPQFSWANTKKSQLKVGLIGCSGRGLGAVDNMLEAAENGLN